LREVRALNSIKKLAGNDAASVRAITASVSQMKSKQAILTNEITEAYKRINNVEKTPAIKQSEMEIAASKKIPANNASLDTYFEKRSGYVAGTTLHPTMRTELFNFVDGKRNYFEIYKALKAEAMAAGAWYYGVVKLEDVMKVLDANVQNGALLVK
jgi:hypothetical protein